MDLQVHVSTTPKINFPFGPYHHVQGRDNLLISPQLRGRTMKTYVKMYYFKSIF